ncbi:MAG: PKD domain-containing protein [Chitinophagaceae bacterium]|nr:PKD domain-containing protein [Chitinophagaceae bacterium]
MKQRVTLVAYLLLIFAYGVAQTPFANFTSNITAGCSPIVVNFKDLSTGNPTSWLWDFGNGNTSTKQNPSATYFNLGTYTVSLTVTNASGSNTTTKTAYITVFAEPVADFSVNKQTGCSPANIQFTDESKTPAGTKITNWKWDFGDGNTSALQNPLYSYRTPGVYTVTLTITNDKGCTKLITKPNYIDISAGVSPSFHFSDPTVCSAPSTVNFTNTSKGPGTLTYNWKFGDGNSSAATNPSHTYNTNGTYRVSLTVASSLGCTDSAAANIAIGLVNTDFIVPAKICPKTTVQFINNSSPRPVKSVWKFSNGITDTFTNALASFRTPGIYKVTLINTYAACTDTFIKSITVSPLPTINFQATPTGQCKAPMVVNFSNNSNGISYVWDFGDSTSKSTDKNPVHIYSKLGKFDVTLIATTADGCSDTLRKAEYIKIYQPIITFLNLPAKGCVPFDANFSANIEAADSVTAYKWNFGDGSAPSSNATPSHTYTNQGTYDVTLVITTSSGCVDTLKKPNAIKVGTKPSADFTSDVNTVCASRLVHFINKSSIPTDEWLWVFSDSTTSTQKDPIHKFSDTGWINVTLIAWNNGCPSDSAVKKKFVYIKPPVSKFSYVPNCDDKFQYTFKNKSIGALTWSWDFGDGTSFNGKNPPVHTFSGNGTYSVSLITTNGSCTDTTTKKIVIEDYIPDFSAAVTEGCKPFTLRINAIAPNPPIRKYIWDFGDGNKIDFDTSSNAQFTYTKPGTFDVTLITVDSFGCKRQLTRPAFVRVNGPIAGFTSATKTGCKGMTTTFIDSTKTDGVNAITLWKWNFGDGTTQTYTSPPFEHTYDSIGDFDVKLVVTDAKGCMDSIFNREFVKISTLKANWTTAGETCPNSPIAFNNLSKSDLPFTSFWDFGNGQTSTNLNAANKYVDTGYYTVKLIVTDLFGCEDSVIKENAVHVSVPVADFTANNFTSYCTPFEAKFTNTSTFYKASFWDLSLKTSTLPNPSIYYTNSGIYPVKLIVTSAGGCKDSTTKSVKIYNSSQATLNYSSVYGCKPYTVDFDAFSKLNASFILDFGDVNVIDTNVNQLQHTYTDFGDFTPKIILREPSGTCVVPITGSQPVRVVGVTANYSVDKTFFCDSGYVSVVDSTTYNDPIKDYEWNFGDGTIYGTPNPPTHQYTNPGSYTVTLVVNTQAGCTDTLTKGPVKIVQSPLITMITDTVICVNDRVVHEGVMLRPDTSTVQWLWTFPNGNTSQQQMSRQLYTKAGNYTVIAIATNSSGCADTVTTNLLVNPLPVITVPTMLTKLVAVPLTIPATYSNNVMTYLWNPSNTLNCSDCPQPITTTKLDTKYVISVVDSNGCRSTETVLVFVTCKGADIFVPNTFSPNGDGSNDVFYVRGKGLNRVKSLRIFNRWGEIVFEKRDIPVNDATAGWDGKFKGNKPQPDVYVYQIEIFCENGEIMRFEGNVALIQ